MKYDDWLQTPVLKVNRTRLLLSRTMVLGCFYELSHLGHFSHCSSSGKYTFGIIWHRPIITVNSLTRFTSVWWCSLCFHLVLQPIVKFHWSAYETPQNNSNSNFPSRYYLKKQAEAFYEHLFGCKPHAYLGISPILSTFIWEEQNWTYFVLSEHSVWWLSK